MFNLRRLNTINSVYGFSFCESLLASLAERLSASALRRSLYTAAYGRFAFYIQEPLGKEELLESLQQRSGNFEERSLGEYLRLRYRYPPD